MQYKVVEKGPMQVMGISIRTSNDPERAVQDIPPHWGRFYSEQIQMRIPYQKTGEVIGLYCDYDSDHTGSYSLVAGCEVTVAADIPKGLVLKHLPAAKYAVFEISGPFPDELMKTWEWIWQSDLDRTYTGDFEIYQIGFDSKDNTDVHIYVAIK